jgi:uncharacterized membrane protein
MDLAPQPSMSQTPLSPRAQAVADAIDRVVLRLANWWLLVAVGWGTAVVGFAALAPLAEGRGYDRLARGIYLAYRPFCHQRAERSFHLAGEKMAFCERDLAIVAGAVFCCIIYAVARRLTTIPAIPGVALVLLIAPMAIDGGTQLVGLRESTWQLRLATGGLFAVASCWLLLPRLDIAFDALKRSIEPETRLATTNPCDTLLESTRCRS